MKFPLKVVLRHKLFPLHSSLFTLRYRSASLWLGQSFAVYLAIIVTWNLVQLHHYLRHHVRRFQVCHMLLDGLIVKSALPRDVGHDIGTVQRVAGRL